MAPAPGRRHRLMLPILPLVGIVVALAGSVVRRLALRPVPARVGAPEAEAGSPTRPEPSRFSATAVRARPPIRHPVLDAPPAAVEPEAPGRRRIRLTESRVLFLGALAVYLVVGALLAFKYDSFNGDAQSRLANAYYMVFSRDPHVAAIGFVWNPLPSLTVLPLILFKGVWPALSERAFAGNIMSALFMAAAVRELHRLFVDLGLRRLPRIVLTVLFAVNPMILYYGGNGMSEALLLWTLLFTTRRLSRWLETGSQSALVGTAVGLAVAYLARNEAVFAAALTGAVVAGVAFRRASGGRRERVLAGLADATIVSLPFAAAFVGWAAVSWIIVGHPFEQFSSVYGTTSQLKIIGAGINTGLAVASPSGFTALEVMLLAPLLPILGLWTAVRAVRRHDVRLLAPLALLGGVLAFAVLFFIAGKTAGWFRYYITAIPLEFLLAGSLLSPRTGAGLRLRRSTGARAAAARRGLLAAFAAAVGLVSIPTATYAMSSPRIGREEHQHLLGVVASRPLSPSERQDGDRYALTAKIAGEIDALRLANGSILVDNFSPCVPFIVLNSRHPAQFVIPNDRDYQRVLADPVQFGVRYLLLPPPGGYGSLDALNRAYPSLYDTGADFATKRREFASTGACPIFRLYRIDDDRQPTLERPA